MFLKVFARAILILTLFLSLAACRIVTGSDENSNLESPRVAKFSINSDDSGPSGDHIITDPGSILTLNAEASPVEELGYLRFIARNNDTRAETQLHECTTSPCSYDWVVDANDNGVYVMIAKVKNPVGEATLFYQGQIAVIIPSAEDNNGGE